MYFATGSHGLFRIVGSLLLAAGASTPITVVASTAKRPSWATACPAAYTWQQKHRALSISQQAASLRAVPSDPALASELAKRFARDQTVRTKLIDAGKTAMDNIKSPEWKAVFAVDAQNFMWLKPEVVAHGFPTADQVGVRGVRDAWALVQHQGLHPAFQAMVLKQVQRRLDSEPFLRPDYAMLSDRVRIEQGKKQLYGTQLNRRFEVKPVDNPANLNERRAALDLDPISDYICVMRSIYHVSGKAS